MVLAGTLGGIIGPTLQKYLGLYIGFLSFAMVALLWIITQELLKSANGLVLKVEQMLTSPEQAHLLPANTKS